MVSDYSDQTTLLSVNQVINLSAQQLLLSGFHLLAKCSAIMQVSCCYMLLMICTHLTFLQTIAWHWFN